MNERSPQELVVELRDKHREEVFELTKGWADQLTEAGATWEYMPPGYQDKGLWYRNYFANPQAEGNSPVFAKALMPDGKVGLFFREKEGLISEADYLDVEQDLTAIAEKVQFKFVQLTLKSGAIIKPGLGSGHEIRG